MARARNIKPSFFKNEDLAELPFSTRLLFIGLWTLADREGRLEDRPKRIKMEVFPGDDCNVEKGLADLHASGFVLRYEADGCRYIQVLAFNKHQTPHYKEAQSTIPKPKVYPINDGHENPGFITQSLNAKPETNPSQAPPDSLIPDSLIPESPSLKKTKTPPTRKKRELAPLPENWKPKPETAQRLSIEFSIPPDGIDRYVEAFTDACRAKGYQYADFDAAFSNCVRQDWPKFRLNGAMAKRKKTAAELIDEAAAERARETSQGQIANHTTEQTH